MLFSSYNEQIRSLASRTANACAEEYFRELVISLADIFEVSTVFVAACADDPVSEIETLALIHKGRIQDNFTYAIEGTPCKVVYEQGIAFFPTRIQGLFPYDEDLKTLGVDSYGGLELFGSNGQTVGHIGIMDVRRISSDVWELPALHTIRERCGLKVEALSRCESVPDTQADYTAILESAADGMFLKKHGGEIVFCNKSFQRMLCFDTEDAASHDAHDGTLDALVTEMEVEFTDELCPVVRRHAARVNDELRFLEITLTPVAETDGRHIFNSGIVRDVSELVHAMEALDENRKLASLGKVATGIAHEISNPLSAIQLSAEVARIKLAEENASKHDVDNCLGAIIDSVFAVSQIVDEVLRTRNSTRTDRRPCNVVEVLSKAIDQTREKARAAGVAVRFEDRSRCMISANSIELRQVFVNLLLNAYQASENSPAGNVDIQVIRSDQRCLISVRDDGCGIDPGTIDKIFEPFYTTRDSDGGTGLGLDISRRIVTSHDGALSCVPCDEGAEFIVDLPLLTNNEDNNP
ncbi:MAG: PAS domain-containing sensor histidine kinase [Planctomycetota bacterium]